ncbi:MAG: hypothetical protein MUF59_00880, partial [Candidatus Krumholzibacteria bacterium]|nr:hypothetical protein [Candidatus Krumholzibacteria bacterium]
MNSKLILRRLSLLVLAVFVATASAAVFAGDVSALTEKPRISEPFTPGDAGSALNSDSREIMQRLPAAPGATINVPGDYATIQAAIDAAVTGDIIVVAAGIYPEAITIDGKDLTITGAGTGLSIIKGSVLNTTSIVYITGGAIVDFSGFTVDGTGKNIKYGIYAFTGTDGDIHDNDVINISYPGAVGLAIRRSDSYIDVTNNTISGFGRIGIYTRDEVILNTDTGVISGNTVTGLGGADPDRLSYGISCYYGNPTISGNHVYDCVSGANVSAWASAGMDIWNGATPAVTGNDIHDSEYGIIVLNCSPVLSGNTFYGIEADDVRIDLIVKGNPTASPYEWYNTIQEAVDAAPVSSYNTLIWVACYSGAGIYEEQVVIDQNLSMYGNYENTVIVSPDDLVAKFTTSVDNYPIVYVHDADNVVIDGLVVDGEGKGNANYRFIGVGYRNAGGTVADVDILNIQDTPFSGAQHGVAMYLYNDDSTARDFQLWNCDFTGFQKNAVALNASSTTALTVDVQGNEITGAGATTVTAQNGIQVSGDMITGVIAGNTINGIAYDNTSATTKWVATSILNYYANVEITDNTVTGAHLGVYHYFGHGPVTGNDLTIEKIGVFAYGVITADPPEVIPSPFDQPEGPVGSSRAFLGAPLADVDVNV